MTVSSTARQDYWKASVTVKHYAVYNLETSTTPDPTNSAEGAGFAPSQPGQTVTSLQPPSLVTRRFDVRRRGGVSKMILSCRRLGILLTSPLHHYITLTKGEGVSAK